MGRLREALHPFWAKGLNEVGPGVSHSFKGWLVGQRFVVSGHDPLTHEFELTTGDCEALISGFALDVDRFASAMLETVLGIDVEGEAGGAKAWPLIRAYYAAFFAGHAITRMFGQSLSNLGRDETAALRAVARQSGLTGFVVHEKMYAFSLSSDGRQVTARPFSDGPHLDTWRQLHTLLAALELRVLTGGAPTRESQDVAAFLSNLNSIMTYEQCGRGNWLSKVRNGLNYRQDYGAWYPAGRGQHWDAVDRCLRSFRNDPLAAIAEPNARPIARFANGCAMTVGLALEMVREMMERHPSNKSFLRARTGKLLADAGG